MNDRQIAPLKAAAPSADGGVAPRPSGIAGGADADATQAVPRLDLQGLEGRITVDQQVSLEVQILTYRELCGVARRMATRIHVAVGGKPVVLCGPEDLASLPEGLQLDAAAQRAVASMPPEDPLTASSGPAARTSALSAALLVPGVIGAINTLGGIAALFRTDLQIQGQQVSPPPMALAAAIAEGLANRDIEVLTPETAFLAPGGRALLDDVETLARRSRSLRAQQTGLASQEPRDTAAMERLDALLMEADDVLARMAPASGRSVSPGARMAATARLLARGEAVLLVCTVVAAGGSNVVRRTFVSGSVRHVGGCAIAWTLIGAAGAVLKSGIEDGIARARVTSAGLQAG